LQKSSLFFLAQTATFNVQISLWERDLNIILHKFIRYNKPQVGLCLFDKENIFTPEKQLEIK